MSELKPCPFCGKLPHVSTCVSEHWGTLDLCVCGTPGCPLRMIEFSYEKWNTRPEVDALQAENARLKGRVAHLAGLVKQAEWNYNESREIECQYCGVYRVKENGDLRNHGSWCPAFTPEGDVK